jgi:hypothetical protein
VKVTECRMCKEVPLEPPHYCNACYERAERKLQDTTARYLRQREILEKLAFATVSGDISFYQRLARQELGP